MLLGVFPALSVPVIERWTVLKSAGVAHAEAGAGLLFTPRLYLTVEFRKQVYLFLVENCEDSVGVLWYL